VLPIFAKEAKMRLKESFTLYPRVLGSGKKVFYYRTYDKKGRRVGGFSTGLSTKTAAREFCNGLLKSGTLIPKRFAVPT
jgi:hypothetical protein